MKTSRNLILIPKILSLVTKEIRAALITHSQSLLPAFQKTIEELISLNDKGTIDIQTIFNKYGIDKKSEEIIVDFLQSQIYYHISKKSGRNLKFLEHIATHESLYLFFKSELLKNIVEENLTFPDLHYVEDYIKKYDSFHQLSNSLKGNTYLSEDLLKHYILTNLILLNAYLTNSQAQNRPIDSFIVELDRMHQIMEIKQISSNEIMLFFYSAKLIIENKIEIYDLIYDMLRNISIQLDPEQINALYTILINVTYINRTNWNKKESDILALYESLFENFSNVFYEFLDPQIIKNVATLCIRTNKVHWFQEVFAKKNKIDLSSKNKDALALCDAKFLFHDQKYKDCIAILNIYKTSDIFQELELRRLQVMCFYELKERVLVDNYLNTYKVYIHRNDTINKVYKDSNNNFIRILNRLNKSIDIKKTEAILEEVNSLPHCSEKRWLEDKCRELIDKLNLSS